MERPAKNVGKKLRPVARRGGKATAAARRPGRKAKARPATARRKNVTLDQRKLDFLRERLGLASDQEVVERVIDDAVADRELIEATLALRGKVDVEDVFGNLEP